MLRRITISYLELREREGLVPGRATDLRVVRAEIPCPELNRFLYAAVGGDWHWTDLLAWRRAQWEEFITRPLFETWVGYVRGTPAGYFELDRHDDGGDEIVHFGLLRQFIGQGYGGHLLTAAVERAFDRGASPVRLHTNTLDGPHALKNYLARGFALVRQEVVVRAVADEPPGPWPGSK